MNDVSRVLRDLTEIFDEMKLDYAVMGGLAVRTYGIPRPTFDVDVTLAASRERLTDFFRVVMQRGYSVPESYQSGSVDEVAGMPLVKLRIYLAQGGVDVDIFLAESEFQRELMQRRRKAKTDEGAIWLISPEDLILLKLMANRTRDLADVLDVLFMQGQLDESYMHKWAVRLNIDNRLEEAIKQHREMD